MTGPIYQLLFGVSCLLLGVFVNEFVRRSNRIEAYAKDIFDRRFSVYEGLWKLILDAYPIANDMIEDVNVSAEERHEVVSEIVMGIVRYCDENILYLNDDVAVHCGSLYMGIEDIAAISDIRERDAAIAGFREGYKKSREIIRAETGLQRLDGLFTKITKAKYSSTVIEYFRHEKAKRDGSRRRK